MSRGRTRISDPKEDIYEDIVPWNKLPEDDSASIDHFFTGNEAEINLPPPTPIASLNTSTPTANTNQTGQNSRMAIPITTIAQAQPAIIRINFGPAVENTRPPVPPTTAFPVASFNKSIEYFGVAAGKYAVYRYKDSKKFVMPDMLTLSRLFAAFLQAKATSNRDLARFIEKNTPYTLIERLEKTRLYFKVKLLKDIATTQQRMLEFSSLILYTQEGWANPNQVLPPLPIITTSKKSPSKQNLELDNPVRYSHVDEKSRFACAVFNVSNADGTPHSAKSLTERLKSFLEKLVETDASLAPLLEVYGEEYAIGTNRNFFRVRVLPNTLFSNEKPNDGAPKALNATKELVFMFANCLTVTGKKNKCWKFEPSKEVINNYALKIKKLLEIPNKQNNRPPFLQSSSTTQPTSSTHAMDEKTETLSRRKRKRSASLCGCNACPSSSISNLRALSHFSVAPKPGREIQTSSQLDSNNVSPGRTVNRKTT